MKEFIVRNKYLLFVLIAGIHLIFKSYLLGDSDLWYDECCSIELAQRNTDVVIGIAAAADPNPPLYLLLVHYWMQVFGDSEFSVRIISVMASSLAAGVLFLLALRFFNWQTSVFSSILFFTSSEFYYYAQEARTYSLVLLFVLISNYLFLSLISRPTLLKTLLLGLANGIVFYLHFLACFNIIAQLLLFPVLMNTNTLFGEKGKLNYTLNKKVLQYYLISGLILLLCILPWKDRILQLVAESSTSTFKAWIAKPTYLQLKECLYDFFNGKYLYYTHFVLAIVFLIVYLTVKKLRAETINKRMLLFAVVIGPGLIYLNYFIASYSPIFLKRYVLFTLIGYFLVFSYLFSLLKIKFYIKLIFFLTLSFFSFKNMIYPRAAAWEYDKAISFFKTVQKNKTTLIVSDMQDLFAYYYDKSVFRIHDYSEKRKALYTNNVYTPLNEMWPLNEDFSKYTDIYYARTFDNYYDGTDIVTKRLLVKYRQVNEISAFSGIKITHYYNPNHKNSTLHH